MALRIHSFPSLFLDDFFAPPKRRRNDWDLINFGMDDALSTTLRSPLFKKGPEMMDVKVDVVEHENDFQVQVDLPGVDMKDVELQVADGMLHLAAKREQVHEEKNEYSHRIERSFGQVKRSVPLPKTAIPDSADARYDNGVLTVEFKKRPALEPAGPRKLAIRSCDNSSVGTDEATCGSSAVSSNCSTPIAADNGDKENISSAEPVPEPEEVAPKKGLRKSPKQHRKLKTLRKSLRR
jgi:HSP20 family molecular chaperone IbpA